MNGTSQWACIATEAEELLEDIRSTVEFERRNKLSGNTNAKKEKTTTQIIEPSPKNDVTADAKVASMFNTNRTYVNQAAKMKEKAPEVFERVKAAGDTAVIAQERIRNCLRIYSMIVHHKFTNRAANASQCVASGCRVVHHPFRWKKIGANMSERLPNGTFAAGHKGGPGRPRRETEREYLDCLVGAVSLSAWRKVIAKAVADAKAGDTKAREWLGRYLLPAPRTDDDGDNRVPMKPDYEYMPISESDFAPAVDRGEPG